MPERQTLITSGQNTRIQPAAPSNVRAPSGAFGDTSGLQTFGRSLESVGNDLSQLQRQRQAMDRRIREEGDRRDASDIHQRLRLVLDNQDTAVAQGLSDAMAKGLRGDDLLKAVDEFGRAGAKAIDSDPQLVALKKKNEKAYAEVASQAVKETEWGVKMNRFKEKVTGYNAELDLQDRMDTTTQLDEKKFGKVATSSLGTLAAFKDMLDDNNARAPLLPAQFRRQRVDAGQRQVLSALRAEALLKPSEDVIKTSQYALSKGIISPDDQAEIEANVIKALNPEGLKAAARDKWKEYAEKQAGGTDVDPEVLREAAATAMATYPEPALKYEKVVKPWILSGISNELRKGTGIGFVGTDYKNTAFFLSELEKPVSSFVDEFVASKFQDQRLKIFQANPGLAEMLGDPSLHTASAADTAEIRNLYKAAATKQMELAKAGRIYENYKDHPKIQTAIKFGTPEQLVAEQETLYERDGVPEEMWVVGDPTDLYALGAQAKMTGEVEANKMATMSQGFWDKYGPKAWQGLISISRNEGDDAMRGIARVVAQQSMAETPDDVARIKRIVPQIAAALSWTRSKAGQETLANPDKTRDNQIVDFYNASFGSAFAGDFDPGVAFMVNKDGRLSSDVLGSPLGLAGTREGTLKPIYEAGLALARYYGHGAQKDDTLAPNLAAAKARSILGTAFIPIITNGGNSDNPVWAIGPVSNVPTDMVSPGSLASFRSQEDFMRTDVAARDAIFFSEKPSFNTPGSVQWDINATMAYILSGHKMGSNATIDRSGLYDRSRRWLTTLHHMPNRDTAFFGMAQDNAHLKGLGLDDFDFANMGILDEKGTFVSISEERVHTGMIPEDMREGVTHYLKSIDKTDVAGRIRVILGNASQWEPNGARGRYDLYVSSGEAFLGNAGRFSKTAPRAQVVVMKKQADGTMKPVPVNLSFAKARILREAFTAGASFLGRKGVSNIIGQHRPERTIFNPELRKRVEAEEQGR